MPQHRRRHLQRGEPLPNVLAVTAHTPSAVVMHEVSDDDCVREVIESFPTELACARVALAHLV